tara:strand:- start:882 stop:1091 length:210 start_codon:yes stop_codon:yes gene_type:complete
MHKFKALEQIPTPPTTPTKRKYVKKLNDKSPIIKHIERVIIDKQGYNREDKEGNKENGIRLPELVLDCV